MLHLFKQKFQKGFSKKGFTLVETLVYSALVVLLLFLIIESAFLVVNSYKTSRSYLDVNGTAVAAFSVLSRDIRRANIVDEINSTLGASSGRLVLLLKNDDGTHDTATFYLEDEKMKLSRNGVYIGELTQGNVAVTNLTFRLFSVASSTAIRTEMTLAPHNQPLVPALNFYGTYMLRGSYVE